MTPSKSPVQEYLAQVQRHFADGDATEHTYRPALKQLVEALDTGVIATNEPKRVQCGAPDFIVCRQGTPLGYLEAKDLGKDLDAAAASEQFRRYLEALPNLVLTDYLEFRLYQSGLYVMSARIGRTGPGGKLHREPTAEVVLQPLFDAFFTAAMPTVGTPKELADRMAGLARLLRGVTAGVFQNETDTTGSLHQQLEAFRRVLLHDLSTEEFADMYAQTICYGLFAACCNHPPARGRFSRQAAAFDLPETNPFLRQMFHYVAGPDLDLRLTWVVDHLAELLNRTDMGEILRDFGRRTRREDPVVHFYETFLAAYDPGLREARGVYYTPEPVVSYIVRSVDEILKSDFKIKDGLADAQKIPLPPQSGGHVPDKTHRVLILDPAAGTGTFLYGVIDQIHQHLLAKKQGGTWDAYVSEHLLPRLFGFELLMAPYAVCHMKLGIQLAELGYTFHSGERLRVYLTNTLEEAFEHGELPLFAHLIAQEANAAGDIKKNAPVMVVLGNPPYSGHSANVSSWISDLLRGHDNTANIETGNYFEVDGQPLRERNPKWINDDYVKFIRFAQWRIERTGHGILAFISNHGYLDNPTFRGMRRSLMHTFDDIYLLDLHGSTKKREVAPDGGKDENVFDIQQGVAIGIFVRRATGKDKREATVWHADLWGVREVWERDKAGRLQLTGGKYATLNQGNVRRTAWTKVKPKAPQYLFVPQDTALLAEYEQGWRLTDAMPVNSVGVATARDKLTVHWAREIVWRTVKDFASLSPEEARSKYQLGKDSPDWKVAWAQADLKRTGPSRAHLSPLLYRPFDSRWTYYTGNSAGFMCRPRTEVMSHMLAGDNVGLSTTRSIEIGRGWEHVFCSDKLIQLHAVSLKEGNYLFPLYLYPKPPEEAHDLFEVAEAAESYGRRRVNFDERFVQDLCVRLKLSFADDGTGNLKKTVGPEDVFHYIYAVLHVPGYRQRYADFLKRDFPRIPLTSNKKLFRALCRSGGRLKELHLLRAMPKGPKTAYPVPGDNLVSAVRYDENGQRVFINDSQFFGGVTLAVWGFHIGGYQVCEKWLKDRKGQELSFDELSVYQRIVGALAETLELMEELDREIEQAGGWPLT
ncbi:MAG: N-6 DNA methylase [Candidatus Hydrogenedentes bacterium]|nr:N-6 DNA methylase [Candidatus Hydrogenedentota bacterium]